MLSPISPLLRSSEDGRRWRCPPTRRRLRRSLGRCRTRSGARAELSNGFILPCRVRWGWREGAPGSEKTTLWLPRSTRRVARDIRSSTSWGSVCRRRRDDPPPRRRVRSPGRRGDRVWPAAGGAKAIVRRRNQVRVGIRRSMATETADPARDSCLSVSLRYAMARVFRAA